MDTSSVESQRDINPVQSEEVFNVFLALSRSTIFFPDPWMDTSSVQSQRDINPVQSEGVLTPSWLSAEAPYASQILGWTHRRFRAREALTLYRVRRFLTPSLRSAEAPYASQILGRTHRLSRAREALTLYRVRRFFPGSHPKHHMLPRSLDGHIVCLEPEGCKHCIKWKRL